MNFKLFLETAERTSLYPWIESLRTTRGDVAPFLVFADWLADNKGRLGQELADYIQVAFKVARNRAETESDSELKLTPDKLNNINIHESRVLYLLKAQGVRIDYSGVIYADIPYYYDTTKMILRYFHRDKKRSAYSKPYKQGLAELALTDVKNEILQLAGVFLTARAISERVIPVIPRGIDVKKLFADIISEFQYYDLEYLIEMTRRTISKVRNQKLYYYNAMDEIGHLETLFLRARNQEQDPTIRQNIENIRRELWRMIKDYENAPVAFKLVNFEDME